MRLTKLANWLSQGDLEKYKDLSQQAQQASAKLTKMELELEKLRNAQQQSQKELAQAKAQLQINQGFQIELGETQLQLKKVETEAARYKKELFELKKEFNLNQSQLNQLHKTIENQSWIQQLKTAIKVTDISKTLAKQNFALLWGFGINTPEVGLMITTGAILVKGWVLSKKAQAQTIRVLYEEEILLETSVKHPRPFVIQQYPDIPTAKNSGFEFTMAIALLTTITKLSLEVVLSDETIVPLCTITLEPQTINVVET